MEKINKLIEEKGGVDFVTAEDLAPFTVEERQKFYEKRRRENNKKRSRYLLDRSGAVSFVRNKATLEDMQEIIKVFQEENPAGKDFRP